MTQLMEKALAEIRKLSDKEQDSLAALILAELESERKWAKAFEESQDLLAELADEALREYSESKSIIVRLNDTC